MHTFIRAIQKRAADRADQCSAWICRSRGLQWAIIVALIAVSLGPEMLGVSARAMAAASCTHCFGPTVNWTSNPYYGNRGTFFADVTGDGRADAIVVNDESIPFGRVVVRPSDGSQFLPNQEWTSEPYYGTRGTFFADVTGDQLADAIVVNDSRITVRRSTGARFAGNVDWTLDPFFGTRGTFFASVVTGCFADAIKVTDSGIKVRPSWGGGFASTDEAWTSDLFYGTRGTFFADVTGDGRADAIAVNDLGIKVRKSLAIERCL